MTTATRPPVWRPSPAAKAKTAEQSRPLASASLALAPVERLRPAPSTIKLRRLALSRTECLRARTRTIKRVWPSRFSLPTSRIHSYTGRRDRKEC